MNRRTVLKIIAGAIATAVVGPAKLLANITMKPRQELIETKINRLLSNFWTKFGEVPEKMYLPPRVWDKFIDELSRCYRRLRIPITDAEASKVDKILYRFHGESMWITRYASWRTAGDKTNHAAQDSSSVFMVRRGRTFPEPGVYLDAGEIK